MKTRFILLKVKAEPAEGSSYATIDCARNPFGILLLQGAPPSKAYCDNRGNPCLILDFVGVNPSAPN